MVKIGFVVEGATEAIVLRADAFNNYLKELQFESVLVIDVQGCKNLLPAKANQHVKVLEDKGSQIIFLLTDLDNDCIAATRQRIDPMNQYVPIVSVKQIESWFLADTQSMRTLLKSEKFFCDHPETIADPFEKINILRSTHVGRKFRSKLTLANEMIKNGFSVQRAAQHTNCPSARYFISKLKQLAG